ncbi:MAG: hypothetical protein HYT61_03000 [Candidatus Yanofskybacteria bacterium]|nr:hypothetical protein [Candidatus Yanofskybacteria bacterium]
MLDDLGAIKKGQTPAGFKIEKESEKEVKTMPEPIPTKIPLSPISHVELGKLEKAKPLPGTAIPPAVLPRVSQPTMQPTMPPISLTKPSLNIPSTGSFWSKFDKAGSKRTLFIIIGLVVLIAAITEFFVYRSQTIPTPIFSPSPSTSPTVTPISIENLFSVVDSVNFSIGGTAPATLVSQFSSSGKLDSLISSGEIGIYKVNNVDGTKRYGFEEFMDGMLANLPLELKTLIDDKNFWLTFMPKIDGTISPGFIVKIQSTDMTPIVRTILKNWEDTMKQTLVNMLQFDQSKASSMVFLDNTYNGTAIRYINFPDHNLTIDYSVILAKNNDAYLVLVNSRDHIFGVIDKIK